MTLLNPGRRAIDKMRRQPSSLKLKDPGKRISSTSASQIQTFVPERADTFEHERKKKIPFLLLHGVLYKYMYSTDFTSTQVPHESYSTAIYFLH